MERVRRIDYSSLKAPIRREDGSLVAEALLTRTGVFTYRNPDGTARREYRPPNQVFDAKSLESFKLRPLTDNHPPVMLDSSNARQYAVGTVGENIRRDGNYVAATIAVTDAATIAKMDAGKTQVSCGYDCELDATPGTTPDGERYDAIQRNIVGNHLAIVDNARAGAAAAVRMDAAAMVDAKKCDACASYMTDDDTACPKCGAAVKRTDSGAGNPAASVTPRRTRTHGDVMNLEQALAALAAANTTIGTERSRADAAEKDARETKSALDAAKQRADKLEGERDEQKSRADAADKARTDAAAGTEALVASRVALLSDAHQVLGPKVKRADGAEVALAAIPNRELKLLVIERVTGAKCDVDDKGAKRPDVYIDARYDGAIERVAASDQVFQGALGVIQTGRNDATSGDPLAAARAETAKARAAMIDRNRNGAMEPSGAGAKGA